MSAPHRSAQPQPDAEGGVVLHGGGIAHALEGTAARPVVAPEWMDLGYWLLVLPVSGVIIHKKTFTDFFALRPANRRSAQRSTCTMCVMFGWT